MIANRTHGPHDELIGHWAASAGHLRAWRLLGQRATRFTGYSSLIRSAGAVTGSSNRFARSRCAATAARTAFIKSP